ncbi:hypothetical protein F4775DRAFT_383732 [Biscogniauxia sp. FL1348]|nr:hypothetical protein F4775DRAFT_383732 [Biscogniauxia sp. FL1348]
MENAVIQELEPLETNLTTFSNDILSYPKEHSSGDDSHNLVTIMTERALDVQGAVDWIAALHAPTARRFSQLYLVIPRWGGLIGMDVQPYLDGVAHFTIGNVHCSYESEQYFGSRELEVKESCEMHLLPEQRERNDSTDRVTGPDVVDKGAIVPRPCCDDFE